MSRQCVLPPPDPCLMGTEYRGPKPPTRPNPMVATTYGDAWTAAMMISFVVFMVAGVLAFGVVSIGLVQMAITLGVMAAVVALFAGLTVVIKKAMPE